MRRALIVATLLAAPALAAAQSSLSIYVDNGRTFTNFVNAAECAGGVSHRVRWTAASVGGATVPPAGAEFTLYASNQAHSTTTSPPSCTKTGNTSGLVAGTVAGPSPASGPTGDALVDVGAMISKAGKTCASNGDTVYLCVEGTFAGAVIAITTNSVLVSTTNPPPPVITGARPGDGAINVTWDAGAQIGSTAETQEYVLEATPSGTLDTSGVHRTGRLTANKYRFDGLVNFVEYEVKAIAFSKADNASDPSAAVSVTPQPVSDFWGVYRDLQGQETGGCSSGVAGPVGLGILALALLLARRRA